MAQNFDRQYRMAAGQAGQTGFEIGGTSDECPVPLHVSFSFEKSDLESQNTGKVEVWNLSPTHLAELEKENCIVSLRAGYGSIMPLIFTGLVSFVKTSQEGADEKTEIEVVDNLIEVRDTYVSVSYSGTVGWKQIFDDVAAQMGVAVIYSYNAAFGELPNGYSYAGMARNILTKGCECNGLTWSIQNGIIQVKKEGDAISQSVYLISAETGLIGSPEKVTISDESGTGANTVGWDVTYFMNGAINVNDYVKLESKNVSGFFYVYSLSINGDNVSGDWTCEARLLELTNNGT